ncbi:tetratricopeptide repeat protein [Sedimenticola selenatireducens]|uniref:tetratricopeptide repeat protein n=1 Tax=Sedimenticola selenatireducens TaxID=191960 RepID=UPI002AABF2A5|nr:tetratricopeptide repeat protein [Sedimenticola selenatireducens]
MKMAKRMNHLSQPLRTGLVLFIFLGILPMNLNAQYAPWIGDTLTGAPCEGKGQSYGPFDYTNPRHRGEHLQLVEGAHFMPRVRSLTEDRLDSAVINDIDYTLRAFPNHHDALYAVTRYWFLPDSFKRVRNRMVSTPPECYFQRAIYFKPDDGTVRMLYGLYLHKLNKYNEALEQYDLAEELAPDSAQLLYNIGLLHFEMKQYEKSLEYARKAYALEYPLPGLRNKLKKKGYWK